MKFVIEKKITCTFESSEKCGNDIRSKIKSLLNDNTDSVNYHISILHTQNNHKIWIFLYDKNGINESERRGKTVYKNSSLVEKFKGIKPTESEIKNALKEIND